MASLERRWLPLCAASLFLYIRPGWTAQRGAPPKAGAALTGLPRSIPFPSSVDLDQKRCGVELEYALAPTPDEDVWRLPPEVYTGALSSFRDEFGFQTTPRAAADGKYGDGQWRAEAEDFDGRRWAAVPEIVEGARYDGVEIVSPPLSGAGESAALARAHDAALAGRRYHRGFASAAHFTYDVSELISPRGDASRLIDAMLFIESNWTKLYAAASPVRYGTIINHYAPPLAIDHPALLAELADLRRSKRTIATVRRLFKGYHDAEIRAQGDAFYDTAWRFRAANYAKAFGLHFAYEAQPLAVVEIRISDLADGAGLNRLRRLFAAALFRAPPQERFDPPFSQPRPWSRLNAEIANQDRAGYEGFLRSLRLNPDDYPFLGGLPGLPEKPSDQELSLALVRAAVTAALPAGGPDLSMTRSGLEAIDRLLASQRLVDRRFAAAALNAFTDALVLPRAAALIADSDVGLRQTSLQLIGNRYVDAAWPILERGIADADPFARYQAVTAIYHRDEDRAAPLLRQALHDSSNNVRSWAWSALGRHVSEASAATLGALASGPDGPAKDQAFKLLQDRRDRAASKELTRLEGRGWLARLGL